MKKILLTFILILGTNYSLLANARQAKYQSLKSRAMGSTTILSEASHSALLSNPAMLNFVDKYEINLLGIDLTTGGNTFDLIDGYKAMIDDIDAIGDDSEGDVIKILKAYIEGEAININGKLYNKDKHKIGNEALVAEISSVISYVKRNFGVGVFASIDINEIKLVDNPSSPFVSYDVIANVEAPIGFARSFGARNQFVLGSSIRYIKGAGARGRLDAQGLIDYTGDDKDDDYTKAVAGFEEFDGYGINVGAIWRRNKLNYGISIENLFSSLSVDTYYKEGNSGVRKNSSESLATIVNIALSSKYHDYERAGNWFEKNLFWTAEIKNIFNEDINGDGEKDDNFWKKIHLGTEISIFNNHLVAFDLRAGFNQGYFAFGFGTELFRFINIEYANYKRELGPHLGMKEEQVHAIGINFKI